MRSFYIVAGIFLILSSVSAMKEMPLSSVIFPDSKVRSITAWQIVEESIGLPEEIFPAYIGSGKIGIGIDASGMQNLDCKIGMEKRYTGVQFETKDELYLFAEGMVSSHYYPVNLMPLGYMHYELSIDAEPINIRESVTSWRRKVNILGAVVDTELTFTQGIKLNITSFTPQEKHQAYFKFQVVSTDGASHTVIIRPQISLRLRERNGGGDILDSTANINHGSNHASLSGKILKNGKHSALEDYSLHYSVDGSNAWADEKSIGAEIDLKAESQPSSQTVRFCVGEIEKTQAYSTAFKNHTKDWENFYESGANISTNRPIRDFLFYNSLYLLRIGGTYNNGMPLEFLLFHPENWHACTFWDLNFMTDAMIKSNNLKQSRNIVKWLNKIVAPKGRPFHWMTLYNGESGMPATSVDSGLGVNAAHAMSAIRYFETTGDVDFLKSTVYPLVRKTSIYIAEERLIKEGDHYIGTGTGIDANTPLLVNDTFSTVWFGVILKKTVEYAKLLNVDTEESKHWNKIADNIQLSTYERGYKYSRDWPYSDGWVWMLLYPTEAMPLLDMKLFAKNREYLNYENLGQPWVYFWQASSDYRAQLNLGESCEKYIDKGIEYTRGPGYFMEAVIGGTMEGLPPYTSAHASYVVASIEQMVMSSIWNNVIEVFTNLPSSLQDRRIEFRNIRTSKGVMISGIYTPDAVQTILLGSGKADVIIRCPKDFAPENVLVLINGQPASAKFGNGRCRLSLELVDGSPITIVVRSK
ncbi:MAG: hypothetical protein ACYC0V_10920 [Armatimonadota bacterium]